MVEYLWSEQAARKGIMKGVREDLHGPGSGLPGGKCRSSSAQTDALRSGGGSIMPEDRVKSCS